MFPYAGFRTLDSVVRCEDLPGSTPILAAA